LVAFYSLFPSPYAFPASIASINIGWLQNNILHICELFKLHLGHLTEQIISVHALSAASGLIAEI